MKSQELNGYSIYRLTSKGKLTWVFSSVPAESPSDAFHARRHQALIRNYKDSCLYLVMDPESNPNNARCVFYPDGRKFGD